MRILRFVGSWFASVLLSLFARQLHQSCPHLLAGCPVALFARIYSESQILAQWQGHSFPNSQSRCRDSYEFSSGMKACMKNHGMVSIQGKTWGSLSLFSLKTLLVLHILLGSGRTRSQHSRSERLVSMSTMSYKHSHAFFFRSPAISGAVTTLYHRSPAHH